MPVKTWYLRSTQMGQSNDWNSTEKGPPTSWVRSKNGPKWLEIVKTIGKGVKIFKILKNFYK